MKTLGRLQLFMSSYLILFLILFFTEISALPSFQWSLAYFRTNLVVLLSAAVYCLLLLISIFAVWAFKKNYGFGRLKDQKTIKIESISNGTQEIISYLISMILPLLGAKPLSSIIFNSEWLTLLTMVSVILLLAIIYTHSNMIVVNPMLSLFGVSLYKMQYTYPNKDVQIEGVLLSTHKIDPEAIKGQLRVFKVADFIFIRKGLVGDVNG